MLLINFKNGNYSVDISDTFEEKTAALKTHASQIGDVKQTMKWLDERSKMLGAKVDLDRVESFIRIHLR